MTISDTIWCVFSVNLKKVSKINANFRISYFAVTQQMMPSRPKNSCKRHNYWAAAVSVVTREVFYT